MITQIELDYMRSLMSHLPRITAALEKIAANTEKIAQNESNLVPNTTWVGVQLQMKERHICGSQIAQYDSDDVLRCRGCGHPITTNEENIIHV